MNTVFLILGTLGSVFALVMTILSMINYRKPRKITLLSTFLSGLIAALSLAAMLWLGGMRLASYLSIPLFMIGLTLGYLRGAGVKLNWENGQVNGRNSILFLVLWGISLAFSQMLGLLGSPLLASLGLAPVFFTTGLQVGLFGHLFLRRLLMGRKGKDRKGLQIVIGLAAGLSLMLITALILVLEIPEILDSFPGVNSVSAQNTNQENTSREVSSSDIPESTNPKPTASLLPGQLPSSGQLLFNCDQEIERQKGYSLNAYNFGSGYTFEEAFTSYEISLDLELDFLDRSFSYYLHQTENWSYIKWGGTADETLRIVEKTTHARGTLNDDGWISGSWQYYWTQPDDPDAEPFEGGNDFYGYLDDQMEEIVICFLSSGTLSDDIRTNELTADFDALQAAGKDQLISSWYHPRACSICKVDGLRP